MESKDLINRFRELSDRAEYRGCPVFTDFLDLASQDILNSPGIGAKASLYGGFDGAERCVARFGDDGDYPITVICISPADMKFSDALTHRDFLGSALALGIERSVIGDIVVYENRGYMFCLDKIADYIIDNLTSVKHTTVKCRVCEGLPKGAVVAPESRTVVAASERLDAVMAAVYNLSRSRSQELIEEGRVFVRGKQIDKSTYQPREGDIISVRGMGRFIFVGSTGVTRKDRLRIEIRQYK